MSILIRWLGDGGSGLLVLSLAVTVGLTLGAIRVRGIRIGVAAVLFAGLVLGQIGWTISPRILPFLRDFSLVLFVYAIGLQVGPGFFSSLRGDGVKLNLLALAVVLIGAGLTAACVFACRLPRESTAGLYAGAFTSTPGFAAGNEVFRTGSSPDRAASASRISSQAFSVAYPFGLFGPIVTIILLRKLLGVRMEEERRLLDQAMEARRSPRIRRDIEVTSEQLVGRRVRDIQALRRGGIILSRLLRAGQTTVPSGQTEIALGDVYRAIGTAAALAEIIPLFGRESARNIELEPGGINRSNLVVTRREILGRTLREINMRSRLGVSIVRVSRAGTEVEPRPELKLHFGDQITVVGPGNALPAVEAELGNCTDTLNRAELVPIFLGIVVGVIVGSIPLIIPGMRGGLKLGLAGGPMIAAILLSRLGRVGSVIWYLPDTATQLLRDFGMAVFLACVGLQAGDQFLQRLVPGLPYAVLGLAIAMLPTLSVCLVCRWVLKMNFVTITGLVAGSMTSSPTLLFGAELTHSKSPAVTYAGVYPLAMIIPIFGCQVLAMLS